MDEEYAGKVSELIPYLQKGEYQSFKDKYKNNTNYELLLMCIEQFIGQGTNLNVKDVISPEKAEIYASELKNKHTTTLQKDEIAYKLLVNSPVKGITMLDNKQPVPTDGRGVQHQQQDRSKQDETKTNVFNG